METKFSFRFFSLFEEKRRRRWKTIQILQLIIRLASQVEVEVERYGLRLFQTEYYNANVTLRLALRTMCIACTHRQRRPHSNGQRRRHSTKFTIAAAADCTGQRLIRIRATKRIATLDTVVCRERVNYSFVINIVEHFRKSVLICFFRR